VLCALASVTCAQLRIVSVNASNRATVTSGPRLGMGTILSAIGSTVSDDPTISGNSGIAKPIDVLCLQEACKARIGHPLMLPGLLPDQADMNWRS
jgi:hypothetical protein